MGGGITNDLASITMDIGLVKGSHHTYNTHMHKQINIKRLGDMDDEAAYRRYWMSRPPGERISAVEDICREYNTWRYSDAERRLQRVVHVIRKT